MFSVTEQTLIVKTAAPTIGPPALVIGVTTLATRLPASVSGAAAPATKLVI